MNKTRFVFSIAVVALLVATPAMGQLLNYPYTALAPSNADGMTSIGVGWGRGLSDSSQKLNAFGAGVTRATEMVSFGFAGAYVDEVGGPDVSEIALRGSVAYNVPMDGSVDVGIQGGIEWMSVEGTPLNTTFWNFPLGVSIQGGTTAGSLEIPLWVMPRVQFLRSSMEGQSSDTNTDFGAAAGVGLVAENGLGLSLSIDWLYTDDGTGTDSNTSRWLFGAAIIYQLQ